ncbi:MAG: fimbrial protein FimV, partial [Paucibacter sp.]|nr:fimbrial protein FimV [Roseateles sp.]
MNKENCAIGAKGRLTRFRHSRVAAAVVLALGLAGNAAYGLGLGKLSVQSALGETLRAEIEVTSLSPEEAGTLKVRVAPPDSYRATGVEYNPILGSADVQVVQREGRTYLRMSSDRAVQEPFVDVILELSWASGRLVREYTLLFDPPTVPRSQQVAPPAVATAPVISAPPAPPVSAPAPLVSAPAPSAAPAPLAAAPAPTPASAPAATRAAAPAPKPEQVAQAPKPAAVTPAPKPAAAPTPASEVQVR